MTPRALTAIAPDAPWKKMTSATLLRFNKTWALTHFALLLLGALDPRFWDLALLAALVDTVSVFVLVKFRIFSFPGQVRLLYSSMLVAAVTVPGLSLLVVPMAAGMASFLALDICPMARSVGRLPWNRPLTPAPQAGAARA